MLAETTAAQSTIGLAATPAALDDACRLVHDRYVARGYMAPHPSGVRVGFHQTLPSTRVFVARDAERVVATVSLVVDSAHGLPCDALYGAELDVMRARGVRLAEVAALAAADESRPEGFATVRTLIYALAVHAVRVARVDTLCITVNPRHTRFYERRLGFERFGPIRAYDAVNGAPAVPLALELTGLKKLHRARQFFAVPPQGPAEVC